jgi:hypothetical protein
MQNLLLDRPTRTAPRTLRVVGALTALTALTTLTALLIPGCKPKLASQGPDANAPLMPVAPKANPSPFSGAITHFLTANVVRTHRSGGEQLIAFDTLVGEPHLSIKIKTKIASFRSKARVFVRTPSGEDQTRVEHLRCSLKNSDTGWTVQGCKVGPTQVRPKPAHMTPPDGDLPGADSIGVPECDRLIKVYRCIQTKVPAASRAALSKGYNTMIQSFRKMAANPTTRKTIAKTCTMALESMRKGARNVPMFKGCI